MYSKPPPLPDQTMVSDPCKDETQEATNIHRTTKTETKTAHVNNHAYAQKQMTKKQIRALPLIFILWTVGYTGVRIGEADNPGHGRRGPKGRNQRAIPKGTMKEHIWLRSHNVGSFRDKAKKRRSAKCRH